MISQPGRDSDQKFEEKDLPLILAAIKKARDAKASGRITIDIADNGGVISIFRELKERMK